MHGIMAAANNGKNIGDKIQRDFPGTKYIAIPLYENSASLTNMDIQARGVISFIEGEIKKEPSAFANGINLICHSQGGLVCRGVVSLWANHPVKAFVSLAGPQQGVDSYSTVASKIPKPLYRLATSIGMYSAQLQSGFKVPGSTGLSVANYFKVMFGSEYDSYQRASKFLAIINNEAPEDRCYFKWFKCKPKTNPVSGLTCKYKGVNGCAWTGDKESQYNRNPEMKTNFARLEKAVFLGSPDDGEIVPWQSTVWGYYAPGYGAKSKTVKMLDYAETVLGEKNLVPLQAMMDANKVVLKNVSGVKHTDWLGAGAFHHYSEYLM